MLQINNNNNRTTAETSLFSRLTRTEHTFDLATLDAMWGIMSVHCMLSYVLPTTYILSLCRVISAAKIHINVFSCLKDSCCTSFQARSLFSIDLPCLLCKSPTSLFMHTFERFLAYYYSNHNALFLLTRKYITLNCEKELGNNRIQNG